MYKNQLRGLYIIIDMLALLIAFFLSYYLRFQSALFSDAVVSFSMSKMLMPVLIILPLLILGNEIVGLYEQHRPIGYFQTLIKVIQVNTVIFLVLIFGLYVLKLMNYSRYMILLMYSLNILINVLMRAIMYGVIVKSIKKFNIKRATLVIGAGDIAAEVIRAVKKSPDWGYYIVGFIDNHVKKIKPHPEITYIGTMGRLEEMLMLHRVDVVIIALAADEYKALADIIGLCEKYGVKTKIVPSYYQYIPSKPNMEVISGLPIIDTRHVPLDDALNAFVKRITDVLIALIGIMITSPIMVICALLTKLTSPGPIIYKQERIGLNRKAFNMYKFRSMRVQGSDEEAKGWSTKGDPRKTAWGSFMRKTSIDELPQLFNVLKGEMSIIGPRPERPQFVEHFKEEIPKYMIKHQVRPGITGWAQVNGWRGDTSIKKRIEFDLFYIENWTYSLDIKIVILTFVKGFINKNAY